MTKESWGKFKKARERFKQETERLSASLPDLKNIQQGFVNSRSETTYTIETPVVYNSALDDFTADDEIKLILTADNPGRREQASQNRRYLVGPSGKIAHKFFRDNPSLHIDYLKNVIILNKTPIHSPRTVELKELCKMDKEELHTNARRHEGNKGEEVHTKAQRHEEHKGNKGEEHHTKARRHEGLIFELEKSQKFMASLLLEFQEALACPVWITGYSEMRKGGIFETYTEELKTLYADKKEMYKQVFIFRHFSMNQFTIDLKKQTQSGETVLKTLKRMGKAYRERILGDFN